MLPLAVSASGQIHSVSLRHLILFGTTSVNKFAYTDAESININDLAAM
jgi:hypothetical protein